MDQRQLQGRPRDPRVDKSIRDAARRLLLDEGYAAVTVERVAKEAQVSKTTIYRRWPSKADLVFDLVVLLTWASPPPVSTNYLFLGFLSLAYRSRLAGFSFISDKGC